jgi:diguanylate cyclase (GGDEF)-like protein
MPDDTRTITLSRFTLGLLLLLAVGLMLVLGLAWLQTREAEHAMQAQARHAAARELDGAIASLAGRAQAQAEALARWEETRQTLVAPDYYRYWRSTRMTNAGTLAAGLVGADIYDATGAILAPSEGAEPMPARLPSMEAFRLDIVREARGARVYAMIPVRVDDNLPQILGYAAIKFDLLLELRGHGEYRFLQPDSLRIDLAPGARIAPDQLGQALRYEIRPAPEFSRLRDVLVRTMLFVAALLCSFALLVYLLMRALVIRPMLRISRHIDSLEDETGAEPLPAFRLHELDKVSRSLSGYRTKLESALSTLSVKSREFWEQAHHDPLTGAFNRRAFEVDAQALSESGTGACLVLLDCDHFKAINDTYGHPAGDQVIRGIAQAIGGALRSGDRLYRIGGDEFATLLVNTEPDQARAVAERCQTLVAQQDFQRHGVTEPVRISVGIAHAVALGEEGMHKLQREADLAMYTAKRPGRDKIAIYRHDEIESGQDAILGHRESSAVFSALDRPELIELHYQPVVHLHQGGISHYEALARIRAQDGTLIMPKDIFPVVEARRLELEFDQAVIARLEMDLASGLLPEQAGVAFNLSGPALMREDMIRRILALKPELSRRPLMIEVTETALITQIGRASAHLERLRDAGFEIALDDFGSGYSSLRYLAGMPVDLVKFDISMIRSLEAENTQAALVADIARMVLGAGYAIVAEGVETQATLARVKNLGFDFAQGWLFGRPMPLADIAHPHDALRSAAA